MGQDRMNLYSKRIAFLISDQHFIPHGGIGSFCKSFTEMCSRLNWKVDIILDKAPNNDSFKELIESAGANTIWPLEPLRYSDHTATFAFSDTINFEKIINFRTAILEAFEENIYDMIVCNTQEAMTAAYAMTVNKYIPVVFYTHLHSMIFRESQGSDVFLDSYHNFYNKHMEFADIIIGTQSQKNIDELTKYGATNCQLLPMPMSERGLLEEYTGTKKGVLFIGRWEEGKNPEAYIKVMKEAQLPCKVMTNINGQKKFEKAFSEAGITDYEIRAGITGQEKVDFVRSSSVFFMPSLRENYPFAFLECLGHMPCVVLDNQDWSDNFDSVFFHKTHISTAADRIKTLYNIDQPSLALDYVNQLDNDVALKWIKFLDDFVSKRSNTNSAKINTYETIKYRDYIKELSRKHLAREDFESVLSNKHKFISVWYTDNDTYLSKDPTYKPVEEITGLGLFEGL
jgi:glycosyltransferase involved in cell wall biosynthesis